MINRRQILSAAALPVIASASPFAMAQQRKIAVSGSGGVVADLNKAVYYGPYTTATGVVIEHFATEQQRMAQLEAMVRAGRTTWDAMEVSGSDYPVGVKKGLLEKIDYSKVDPNGVLPAMARQPYGVGVATYSEVLVVRKDRLPAGKSMTSWAQFWDGKTFPGPRSLSARPQGNLEFALIADGVALGKIYEVLGSKDGVKRAFAKLDQIKPLIAKFWKSGAESVQLLTSGEAVFGSTFNGRVGALQAGGIPVEAVWNGGALHTSFIGIPKGAPNKADALDFIRFRTTDPVPMRQYIAKVPYPGFAPNLTDGMPEEAARSLPTHPANLAVQFASDETFWAGNLDAIQESWNEWMLK
ncbi:MAG: ABC transporter substrate-binding protein [Burkholderiaceae bacterium]